MSQFKGELSKTSEVSLQNIGRDVDKIRGEVTGLKAEVRFDLEKMGGNQRLGEAISYSKH